MENEHLKEIERLKADCATLEEQVKLLVMVELKLRRTKAELAKSKKKIEEYNRTLEQKVEERTYELKNAQQQLIETAHRAGMAEIATGVVHNLGNILNSISISAEEISTTSKNSALSELSKATGLLQKNKSRISEFLSSDPTGEKLINYFLLLESVLKAENNKVRKETASLMQNLDVMRTVILTQQDYAFSNLFFEPLCLTTVIEDALTILHEQLKRTNILITKDYGQLSNVVVSVQKSKLIQILINLIKNAAEALLGNDLNNRFIKIELNLDPNSNIILSVTDNGEGIKATALKKIFTHGYTTKRDGHGFGLHNSANFMADMGGRIKAESDGEGHGSKFTLYFPPIDDSKK